MIASVPANHFDRGKPFYPLVINYLVHFHGFVELDSRYVVERLAGFDPQRIEEAFEKKGLGSIAKKLAGSGVTQLIGNLELRSEFQRNNIAIDARALTAEIVSEHSHLLSFLMPLAAGSVLIAAYEMTKHCRDEGPLWEFFRHCRNAAAHNGRFHFTRGEPKRPAEWGRFKLELSMHGTPLFSGKGTTGLLGPGDPIRLLWDIEQAYPNMHRGQCDSSMPSQAMRASKRHCTSSNGRDVPTTSA
jgi:hypothetical protein